MGRMSTEYPETKKNLLKIYNEQSTTLSHKKMPIEAKILITSVVIAVPLFVSLMVLLINDKEKTRKFKIIEYCLYGNTLIFFVIFLFGVWTY